MAQASLEPGTFRPPILRYEDCLQSYATKTVSISPYIRDRMEALGTGVCIVLVNTGDEENVELSSSVL